MNHINLQTANPAASQYDAYTTFLWVRDTLVEIVNEQPNDGDPPIMDIDVKLHETPGDILDALRRAAIANMRIARPPASKEYDEAARSAHWLSIIDSTNDVKALMNFARQNPLMMLHITASEIAAYGMQYERSEHAIRRNDWLVEQERKAAGAKAAGEVSDATKLTDAELWSAIANAEANIGGARNAGIKLKWLNVSMLVLKEANARGYTYDNLKAAFTN